MTPTPRTVAGIIVAVTRVSFHCEVNATTKALTTVDIFCSESPNLSDNPDWMVLQWEDSAKEAAPEDEVVS